MKLPPPFENALILTGPTASGKTALGIELARELGAEIIAMDSMTLYRGMDIGTAKPTAEEQRSIRHHLLDVLDPWDSGNVAWWLERAAECAREIEARGRRVLFVGGTPFYLKALMHGLFESPPGDAEVRRALEHLAESEGSLALHARLAEVDPATARRLHSNDVRRVVRALEVWRLTGRPISDWQQQGWWTDRNTTEHPAANPCCIAIDLPREDLYARINRRVEAMIEAGWIDEVQRLRKLPRPLSKEASMALGYRELTEYLDGRQPLSGTIALIQMRSRQFAKRQLTWFRNLPGCTIAEGKLTFDLWCGKIS